MHSPLLAQAALPAPTVVCGMLLRPFSLGHELLLIRENLQSAICRQQLDSLCGAVLICGDPERCPVMGKEWFCEACLLDAIDAFVDELASEQLAKTGDVHP